MKKLLSMFLATVFVLGSSLAATGGTLEINSTQNGKMNNQTFMVASDENSPGGGTLGFSMATKTAPISTFDFSQDGGFSNYDLATTFNGSTKERDIAEITISNNTIDGFSLYIESAKNGILEKQGETHGEQDLNYKLSLTYSSTGISTNADEDLKLITQTGNGVVGLSSGRAKIVDVTSQNQKTDSLVINLKFELVTNGEMAGNYDEVLTYIYTDR